MSKYKPGLAPNELAELDQTQARVREWVLHVAAKEAAHELTCTDEECGGYAFPLLNRDYTNREALVIIAATAIEIIAEITRSTMPPRMQHMADMIVAVKKDLERAMKDDLQGAEGDQHNPPEA